MLGSRSGQGDAFGRQSNTEARELTPAGEGKSAATAKNEPAGQFSDWGDDIPS